jgi:hypothetical protein
MQVYPCLVFMDMLNDYALKVSVKNFVFMNSHYPAMLQNTIVLIKHRFSLLCPHSRDTHCFFTFFSNYVKQNPYAFGMHYLKLLYVESEEDVLLVPKNELQETQKTNAAKA